MKTWYAITVGFSLGVIVCGVAIFLDPRWGLNGPIVELYEAAPVFSTGRCLGLDSDCNVIAADFPCAQPDPNSELAKNLDKCLGGSRYTRGVKP